MNDILKELVVAIRSYEDAHPNEVVEVDEELASPELKRYWNAIESAEKYLVKKSYRNQIDQLYNSKRI